MFDTLCSLIPRDADYPPRVAMLDMLTRVLNGTLYDVLSHEFDEEKDASGHYIPLRRRRPSVRYNLARIVVEDSVALLFSEGHFPTVDCADAEVRGFFADLVTETRLNETMIDAAIRGSIGSVALLMRVLQGRVFVSVLDTLYLTPEWRAEAPDTLACVTERYKVRGSLLAAQGYEIADPGADYWFMRRWDDQSETWYLPWPAGLEEAVAPEIDPNRTLLHGLGFVPLVWIRNLPGGATPDGACTFRAAIETAIEIDYQLSQAGRGLKYSSDPALLIKDPSTTDRDIIKGAGNALVVGKDGDARLLEIGGTAASAVIDYVRALREYALESVHGNRASADRIAAAQSGRALELMNQGLIWLADNLRISYGACGLLPLLQMIALASRRYRITALGRPAPPMDETTRLGLRWRPWYPPAASDRLAEAQALRTLYEAGLLSQEAAQRIIAESYSVQSAEATSTPSSEEKPRHDDDRRGGAGSGAAG